MIQRIQTLYLLAVVLLMSASVFLPIAYFTGGEQTFELFSFGLKDAAGNMAQPAIYMAIMLIAAWILPVFIIFLFKRRMLQIRLCAVEMVLLVGCVIMMSVYYFLSYRAFSDMEFHSQGFRIPMIFPMICIVFTYLATRAVFKDEMLVRSQNRIR